MRIACLQFAPEIGKVKENIACVDSILEDASTENLDLLVLPELAFTGCESMTIHDLHSYG